MIKHVDELVRDCRINVGEHPDQGVTLSKDVLTKINNAKDGILNKILAMNHLFLCTYYDLSLDGSLEYTLPLYVDRIAAIEDISTSASSPQDTEPIYFENRFKYLNDYVGGSNQGINFYKKGRSLGIPSKMSSGTLRIYYPIQPANLFRDILDSQTSTTITFPSATTNRLGKMVLVDGYYNGSFAVDKTSGEYHEITDWDASTRVATCGTWVNTPSEISIACPLSPRFQELISLEASIRWRQILDDPVTDMKFQVRELWKDLEELIIVDVTQRNEHVKQRR